MPGSDEYDPEEPEPTEPVSERVRIYGAEKAGSVAGGQRLPDGGSGGTVENDKTGSSLEDRYLGFSHSTDDERSQLSASAPLSGYEDPTVSDEPSGSVPVLQHWTDPPTGQVPAVVARHDDDERTESWGSGGPSWREHDHEWEDTEFEPSLLGDEATRLGALDETPLSERRPWEFGDLSSSDEAAEGPAPEAEARVWESRSRWADDSDERAAGEQWWDEEDDSEKGYWEDEADEASAFGVDTQVGRAVTARVGAADAESGGPRTSGSPDDALTASISSSPLRTGGRRTSAGASRMQRRRPTRPSDRTGGGAGRDVPVAIATGVGLAVLALICFKLGALATEVLATVVVTLAAAECYAALRRAGKRPATLLGLVATIGVMVSVYAKGVSAFPLLLALLVIASMIWYLAGAEKGSPVEGITTTILGFVWVAGLGSFAALMLAPSQYPHRHGVAFMLGAVVATVAYDVGALALGGWLGRHPLAPRISPRKTWEGAIGGAVLALAASVGLTGQVHPWTPGKDAVLGLVVAVVAPIGDLCESLIKRDLGLKDMGSLLPGHGGLLDRVDALLFVLPATYYLVRVLHLG